MCVCDWSRNQTSVQRAKHTKWLRHDFIISVLMYLYVKFIYENRFDFVSDCCFAVQVPKGPRGLGLSVSGGVDTNAAFPGLIRIKRLFPNQSAWCTGMLQPGDILLEANGVPLTGLTNHVISLLYFFVHHQFLPHPLPARTLFTESII